MQLTLTLPDRESTLAFHRQRWEEVLADSLLASFPGRVETNAFGQIVMSPPGRFFHGHYQTRIASMLAQHLGGQTAVETGVITSDGVKIIDVVWLSPAFFKSLEDPAVLEHAPEICVEVLSPSNRPQEIEHKFRLYFDAGAIECWQCGLQGQMTYYHHTNPNTQQTHSILCPEFPAQMSD